MPDEPAPVAADAPAAAPPPPPPPPPGLGVPETRGGNVDASMIPRIEGTTGGTVSVVLGELFAVKGKR